MTGDASFALVPLDCPGCGAAVAADGEDVVYYCTACRNGYRFDERGRRLEPVAVSFVALADRAVDRYLPFWLLPATVTIEERVAAGSGLRGLMSFFLGRDEPAATRGEGTFAVPAFTASLTAVTGLTDSYTRRLPTLGEKLGERLVGGVYDAAEAGKLARYTVIATEVAKPDTLKDLKYSIEFGEPRLLGVPFVVGDGGLADALFGIGL